MLGLEELVPARWQSVNSVPPESLALSGTVSPVTWLIAWWKEQLPSLGRAFLGKQNHQPGIGVGVTFSVV